MKKTAEAVSLGHPDKIADYISSYILDRMIEQDPSVKYAVEVMVKANTVVFGGEITGKVDLWDLPCYVADALAEIGYTKEYSTKWKNNAINPNAIKIVNMIGTQSPDINQGVVQNGWGDQGVFVGYACKGEANLPKEVYLAHKLNHVLYEFAKNSDNLGIDIKTQITLDDQGNIDTAIAAVPMMEKVDLTDIICKTLNEHPKNIIVNGTGIYQTHSSIADCGITGRKLACDFYSMTAPIGGGCPWTKDGSKADLTLNLYARELALKYLDDNDECLVYLSSCIGKSELPSAAIKCFKNGKIKTQNIEITQTPRDLITHFHLNKPVYATMCKKGIMTYISDLLANP